MNLVSHYENNHRSTNVPSSICQRWIQWKPNSQCWRSHPEGQMPPHTCLSVQHPLQWVQGSPQTASHPPTEQNNTKYQQLFTQQNVTDSNLLHTSNTRSSSVLSKYMWTDLVRWLEHIDEEVIGHYIKLLHIFSLHISRSHQRTPGKTEALLTARVD